MRSTDYARDKYQVPQFLLTNKQLAIKIQNTDNRIFRTSALWDTGATNCVIKKQTVKDLYLMDKPD